MSAAFFERTSFGYLYSFRFLKSLLSYLELRLISTRINYTAPLSEHLDSVSHDVISNF
jgi:hypothetical protein